MERQQSSFYFQVFHSIEELSDADASLLKMAKDATSHAYAPYSHFHVGAVARLHNGVFVRGSNQENASYPVGICAERVLLSSVSSQHPDTSIDSIAISYDNRNGESNKPVTPCGICRQTLSEYEQRQQQPIRLILAGMEGDIYIIEKASYLLPLGFSGDDMK